MTQTNKPISSHSSKPFDAIHALEHRLKEHVFHLAGAIGARNLAKLEALDAAAAYIEAYWSHLGLKVHAHPFTVEGMEVANLEVIVPSQNRGPALVLGAHYDTVIGGGPGADDNASGVAVLLELTNLLSRKVHRSPIYLVAFVNEEPPFFKTENMGSMVYAKQARERGAAIQLMISLESLGYYSDEKGSQHYPFPLNFFYPDRGNFLAVVGNFGSRKWVTDFAASFAEVSDFPVEHAVLPRFVPGVDWSDHASFWRHGYQAIMLTDTALFRNPFYHALGDVPQIIDYARLAKVTLGIAGVIELWNGVTRDEQANGASALSRPIPPQADNGK